MTPEQIQKFYAMPVLASAPVVEYGEGDFSYNGLRGLAGLGQVAPSSFFTNADGSLKWTSVGLALAAAGVAYAAWMR